MSLGILRTVWRAVCEWDTQGGSWDVPRDPPDSMEGCVCMGHPGRILGCPRAPPDSVEGCV